MNAYILSVYEHRVLTFAIVYLVFGLPNLDVCPRSFREIRQGMAEHEVDKVLGAPSDIKDFSRFTVIKKVPARKGIRGFRMMKTKTWVGADRVIVVHFGEKGTVEWTEFEPLEQWAEFRYTDSCSLLEMARYRLITLHSGKG